MILFFRFFNATMTTNHFWGLLWFLLFICTEMHITLFNCHVYNTRAMPSNLFFLHSTNNTDVGVLLRYKIQNAKIYSKWLWFLSSIFQSPLDTNERKNKTRIRLHSKPFLNMQKRPTDFNCQLISYFDP